MTTVHHDTPLPDRVRLAEAEAQVEHLQGLVDAARNTAAAAMCKYDQNLDAEFAPYDLASQIYAITKAAS